MDDPGQTFTLIIERMRLALPPGYAGRAHAIARRVVSELAAQLSRAPLPPSGRIGAVSLPAITAQPGETDAALAIRIAGALRAEIARGLAGREHADGQHAGPPLPGYAARATPGGHAAHTAPGGPAATSRVR